MYVYYIVYMLQCTLNFEWFYNFAIFVGYEPIVKVYIREH